MGLCVTLNVTKWLMSVRPGNCKITIDYALPAYIIANANFYLRYPYWETSWGYWTPLTVQFKVLLQVLTDPDESGNKSSSETKLFLHGWVQRVNRYTYQNHRSLISVYFLVTLRSATCNFIDKDDVTHSIYQLKPIKFEPQFVPSQYWREREAVGLKSIIRAGNTDETSWRLIFMWDTRLRESLEYCSSYGRLGKMQEIGSVEERMARKADADAHVLQLIMGNLTYFT